MEGSISHELPHACGWDTGFPAISGDGNTIARLWQPDMAGRQSYEWAVELVDVHTSRVRRMPIVTREEDWKPGDREVLWRNVSERVAAIQRFLDANRYRSMLDMGTGGGTEGFAPKPREQPPVTVYADIIDDQVRLVDPASATVIARHGFGFVPRPDPYKPEESCSGWGLFRVTVSWDPPTRTMLAVQKYRRGGCMCADVSIPRVARPR
jgi:hypothetical protein